MFKKGISVFTGLEDYSLENNIKYLNEAKDQGFEIVFSSAHITEASTTFDDLQALINETSRLNLKLSLDISKKVFDKIQLPTNLYALRLDFGFSEEDLINLSNTQPYMIEINASVYSKKRILELIEKGLNPKNIRASFNYYPKLYTGHTIEFVKEMTEFYHSLQMTVGAFIPSKTGFRPPMYEGLPTVESHRKMPLSIAIEELKICGIDEIIFGDAYASIDELQILSDHNCDEIILDTDFYCDYQNFTNQYVIRPDYNDLLLRLSMTRNEDDILPFNTTKRNQYDLTIDNNLFKRYKGEINICLKDLEKDQRVNVIGHLNTTSLIIDEIKKGKKFIFKKSL